MSVNFRFEIPSDFDLNSLSEVCILQFNFKCFFVNCWILLHFDTSYRSVAREIGIKY